MLEGSCLCGDVAWRVNGPVSPVESCHCSRCRKSSGSAFLPMLAVKPRDFRFLRGEDRVQVFRLPVLRRPPGYTRPFCSRCGSPVPLLDPAAPILEIPAGTIDGDPTPPAAIIESERRRTPLTGDTNFLFDDCPICRLLAEDGGGITLVEVGSGGSLAAALLGEGPAADRFVAGSFAAPRFEELRQLLNPLPRPWNPAAATAEKTTRLAEAAASRTGSLWMMAVGEVQEDEVGMRYVDVVLKRRDAPAEHQRVELRGTGEYSRVRLTTLLLDCLRRRLRR